MSYQWKKNPSLKKNPDNSDVIHCSGAAVHITNRHTHLPETLPDIHRSTQLLRSSEIGPIDHQRLATVGPPRGAVWSSGCLGGLPKLASKSLGAGHLLDISPSSVGVEWTDGYQELSPGGVYVDW